jgi:uncharacterized protein (DUF885 family)
MGRLAASPVSATAVGVREWDDSMGDASPEGQEKNRKLLQAQLEEARALEGEELGEVDGVTLGELIGSIQRDLDDLSTGTEEWMVSHFMGPSTFLMSVPDMQSLRTPEETAAYSARIEDMPRWIDQVLSNYRRGLAAGKVSPLRPVERAVAQLIHLLGEETENWTLYKHYQTAPERCREAEAARGKKALEEGVRPAMERFQKLLMEEILPLTRSDDYPGMMHVEGGAEAYEKMIRYHTSLDLSAEEIHQIGLGEVKRIRKEFQRLGQAILGTEDIPTIQKRLREDKSFRYETSEEIEQVARDAVLRAEAKVSEYFGLKPTTDCVVKPIPDHEAPNSTLAYYRQPSPDGDRPGTYMINTYAPTTRPKYEAEVLAFHEAVPGHHLQIDIAQKLDGLPEFRRHGGVTSYIEGWALYTEKLSEEMGLYSGDLDKIGARSFDAWRACRLVVDTGLHALGWTREQAIDFMLENTLLTRDNIVNEVDRYLIMPGQALSYKLGELEIFRLRRKAEQALGDKFSLPAFHDRVLEMGAVCLEVLGQRIDKWIEETR